MTKSGMSDLLFTISIFPNPTGQPARLEKLGWKIPNSTSQQWHQALVLEETPRHAPVWVQ